MASGSNHAQRKKLYKRRKHSGCAIRLSLRLVLQLHTDRLRRRWRYGKSQCQRQSDKRNNRWSTDLSTTYLPRRKLRYNLFRILWSRHGNGIIVYRNKYIRTQWTVHVLRTIRTMWTSRPDEPHETDGNGKGAFGSFRPVIQIRIQYRQQCRYDACDVFRRFNETYHSKRRDL